MKIFLDDFRTPENAAKYMHARIGNLNSIYLEEWNVVKTYDEFTKLVKFAYSSGKEVTHVSFDHDLADEHYSSEYQQMPELYDTCQEKTGFDCAKFLKDVYKAQGLKLPIIFVHSMNPVGTDRIINLFENDS